jgi:hypothetical protein
MAVSSIKHHQPSSLFHILRGKWLRDFETLYVMHVFSCGWRLVVCMLEWNAVLEDSWNDDQVYVNTSVVWEVG